MTPGAIKERWQERLSALNTELAANKLRLTLLTGTEDDEWIDQLHIDIAQGEAEIASYEDALDILQGVI